jgi:hypothetical protein
MLFCFECQKMLPRGLQGSVGPQFQGLGEPIACAMNGFDFKTLCLELEEFGAQAADHDLQSNLVKGGAW